MTPQDDVPHASPEFQSRRPSTSPQQQDPQDEPQRQPRHLSRRASWLGSIIAVLVVLAMGGAAWYLTHPKSAGDGPGAGAPPGAGGPPGGRRSMATTVGVATAERTDVPVILEALGTVTPQATVRVRPQVSGVLEKVLFKEGQMVRQGELLATIDPRQFEMAVMQAAGQRQRDEAQLESARVTLERFKTLLTQDSIARQEVDTQAALVKQLEGTLAIDRANEGTARLNLGYTRVVAPISGRVGLRTVDVGNVVSSSDANGVAVITQLAPIDVVFAVPQDQVGELQQLTTAVPGAKAAAAGSTPMKVTALDRTRSNVLDVGVFASLDNQIDTTTGTVKAKARFDNSKLTLFPSQFVNVQLLVKTLQDAVAVPVAAVRRGNSGDYVYVLNEGPRTVSMRTVQRGQATADKIVIASGLKAGERVITEGADRLKDGAPVSLPDDPRRGPGATEAQGPRSGAGQAGANRGNRGNQDASGAENGSPAGTRRPRPDGAPAGPRSPSPDAAAVPAGEPSARRAGDSAEAAPDAAAPRRTQAPAAGS